MALTPQRKNSAVVSRATRTQVQSRTNLTSFTADSKVRTVLDILADQVVEERNQMIEALYSRQISTAVGDQLDAIGADLGVPRLGSDFAEATASERSFGFYVSSGTFGDLNAGNSFPIPAGVTVETDPNGNDRGSSLKYVTTSEVTCQAGASVVFVGIKAVSSGSQYRIGAGVLKTHNFTSFPSIQCANFYAILNGRDTETDQAYRFRLAANYDRLISSNESKIRLTSIRVPGVVDVKIIPGYHGIGTVAVAVLGANYSSNSNLVGAVQSRLNSIVGPASRVTAMPALTTMFDLELSLVPIRPLTVFEQSQIEASIRRTAFDYFRTVRLGSVVSLDTLASDIRRALSSSALVTITRSSNSVFSRTFVRRGQGTDISEREQLLTKNYVLDNAAYADLGTLDISFVSST